VGKGDTEVKVDQTNVQTQQTNINSTLSDTVNGLVDVLKTQAANPAIYTPITVTPGGSGYGNSDISTLMSLMYLQTARGQQNVGDTGQAPDTIKTIFIAAVIVVIVIFVGRRLKI